MRAMIDLLCNSIAKIQDVEIDYSVIDRMIVDFSKQGDKLQRLIWQVLYENRPPKKGMKRYVKH